MADRVVMNVLHMPPKIMGITDLVFPEAALPDRPLILAPARGWRHIGRIAFASAAEIAFNQPPSQGKVGIPIRQGPDTMQVIGQQYKGIDTKRMGTHDPPHAVTQQLHIILAGQYLLPPERNHREKIAPTRSPGTPVTHCPTPSFSPMIYLSGCTIKQRRLG